MTINEQPRPRPTQDRIRLTVSADIIQTGVKGFIERHIALGQNPRTALFSLSSDSPDVVVTFHGGLTIAVRAESVLEGALSAMTEFGFNRRNRIAETAQGDDGLIIRRLRYPSETIPGVSFVRDFTERAEGDAIVSKMSWYVETAREDSPQSSA